MDAFWPGPLTLMVRPQTTLAWDLPSDTPLALRMPIHPVALALLEAAGPLVATTANIPGLPAPTNVDDALGQFADVLSIELDAGDLADPDALASTVVDLTGPVPRVVREGAIGVTELLAICDIEVPEAGGLGQ
jgi:tRNA threonylcarbamoyl adenosine modification protein (Sua5/YciO/YrdC/YwlC family)